MQDRNLEVEYYSGGDGLEALEAVSNKI